MNKKELSKYYHLAIEIQSIEEKIKMIEECSIGSSKITGMPFSGNISNPIQQRIELIEKYSEKLEYKKSKAIEEMIKIENYLSTIEDLETRLIFNKRYIELKKWEKIAIEMHMSEATIYRRHSDQLKGEIRC